MPLPRRRAHRAPAPAPATGTGTTIASVQSATSATMSANATATAAAIVFTLGRPNELAEFARVVELWGNVEDHDGSGVQFRAVNDDIAQGRITTTMGARSGAGGSMTVDSGTGGSAVVVKAAQLGLTDHTGAKKV